MIRMGTEAKHEVIPGGYVTATMCRLCASKQLVPVLSLGDQYVPTFLTEKNVLAPKAPLNLVQCDECWLIQLKESVDPALLWGRDYWYRSGVNATMRAALGDVVREGLQYHSSGVWADIGANDGTLLSKVPDDFTRIGIEPTSSFQHLLQEHADIVVNQFFSAEHDALREVDVVTSCACFYDVDDPAQFVRDVAKVLSPDGVWINQFSDAQSMVRKNAWDWICHEHKVYWDLPNLAALYESHGLHIWNVTYNDVNGGSIRVTAKKSQPDGTSPTLGIPKVAPVKLDLFAQRTRRWRQMGQDLLQMPSVAAEPLWALGASTKGCTMLQYLGMNERFLAIADRNPLKHGLVMSGTWLPVVAEDSLRRAQPRYVVPLIWAFRQELSEREAELRNGGTTMLWPLPNWELEV